MGAQGSYQRTSTWLDSDSIFFSGAEGDLLWFCFGEMLPPNVTSTLYVGCEIHPAPIRRPPGRRASTAWANCSGCWLALERNQATWGPLSGSVHLYQQRPMAVRRRERIMNHSSFVCWEIDLSQV